MDWLKKIFSSDGTQGAGTSLGVMAPVVAIVAMAINAWVGDEVVQSEELTSIIGQIIALVGLILGIIGRIRAKKALSGAPLEAAK